MGDSLNAERSLLRKGVPTKPGNRSGQLQARAARDTAHTIPLYHPAAAEERQVHAFAATIVSTVDDPNSRLVLFLNQLSECTAACICNKKRRLNPEPLQSMHGMTELPLWRDRGEDDRNPCQRWDGGGRRTRYEVV